MFINYLHLPSQSKGLYSAAKLPTFCDTSQYSKPIFLNPTHRCAYQIMPIELRKISEMPKGAT